MRKLIPRFFVIFLRPKDEVVARFLPIRERLEQRELLIFSIFGGFHEFETRKE